MKPLRSRLRTSWRVRTLVVAVASLLLALLLATWGCARGLPPSLWGDESRHAGQVRDAALGLVFQPWRATTADAAWPAPLGRWAVPLVLLWLAGEGLTTLVAHRLRRALMLRSGGHTVLFGLGPTGEALMLAWLRAGRSVLVVSDRDEDRVTAQRHGAAWLHGTWSDAVTHARSGLAEAAVATCIADADASNVDAALAVLAWIADRRAAERPLLQLYVHVGDAFLRARLDQRLGGLAQRDLVELHVFSSAQIAVRRLLRDHPLDAWQDAATAGPCLWIFGLGPAAEELAVSALRLARCRHGLPPRIALVGREAEALQGAFRDRWPGAAEVGRLHFEAAGIEQGERLFTRLVEACGAPTAVYFCDDDEAANLAGELALVTAFEQAGRAVPPIHSRRLRGGAIPGREELAAQPWLVHFGAADGVAAELVFGEQLDSMARSVHERYVTEALAAGEALGARRSLQHWPALPEDLKDDNRNVADHHFVKLRDTFRVLAPAAPDTPASTWDDDEVEALAEVEHARWQAQRELTGWRYAPTRNDAERQHPDLVPWSRLPGPRRELDRATVRQVPALLSTLGLMMRREHAVRVTGPRSPWAFTATFEAALDEVLADVRERAVPGVARLWLASDSALVWRLAERWLERGAGLLGIVLHEPAAQLLARQPRPEIRRRVLAVLGAADRVRFAPHAATGTDDGVEASHALQLSIDGSDLVAGPRGWGLDAEGRVLFRPETEAAK